MTNQTKLTFWGGLDTIGGNIVSIESGQHRIITDFGALSGVSIEALLKDGMTEQLLKKQQLPAIPGLYPKTSLGKNDLESYEESSMETIICLSHLHLDHLGGFSQLPADLPIYALEEAINTYQVLDQNQLLPHYQVNWQIAGIEQAFEFGPFNITFYENDHDAPGSASLFITTPDLKIVYSGDFRLTGFHPEKVLHWACKAREYKPDLLLVEGTTFSFSTEKSELSETEIELAALTQSINAPNEVKLMRSVKQLMLRHPHELFVFNGYPQNIDRIVALGKVASGMGRTLVLDEAYYQLLLPYITEDMRVKKYNPTVAEETEKTVSLTLLKQQPQDYVLQIDYDRHQHLFDLPAGIYLHSNGMPLGFFMPEYEPFVRKVIASDWQFYHANVSGHAATADLLSINYIIQPSLVVPWHTFKPEEYADALEEIGLSTWLPLYHQEYGAADIQELINRKEIVIK